MWLLCDSGWSGPDCKKRQLRPCTDTFRFNVLSEEPTQQDGAFTSRPLPSTCAGISLSQPLVLSIVFCSLALSTLGWLSAICCAWASKGWSMKIYLLTSSGRWLQISCLSSFLKQSALLPWKSSCMIALGVGSHLLMTKFDLMTKNLMPSYSIHCMAYLVDRAQFILASFLLISCSFKWSVWYLLQVYVMRRWVTAIAMVHREEFRR